MSKAAFDGTKVGASASKRSLYDQKRLDKELEAVRLRRLWAVEKADAKQSVAARCLRLAKLMLQDKYFWVSRRV